LPQRKVWGEKDGVLSNGGLGTNPHLIGVEHRDAGAHEALVDAVLHDLGDLRQLDAVVDAQELLVVVAVDGRDWLAHAHVDAYHVGEVVLALGVVVGDLVDVGREALAAEAVGAGVALEERGALLGRAVLVLDDGVHAAVLDEHTAVARDVRRRHGKQRAGVVACAGSVYQGRNGLGANERQVAVENHHGSGKPAQGVAHHAHGVAGAQALGLLDKLHVLLVRKVRADLIGTVANHQHDAIDAGLAGGVDNPPCERLVEDLVHDLGVVGLHARSLAGG
jgi:hypothetical protein